MTEDQLIYHELEGLQELGLLDKGVNIARVLPEIIKERQADELTMLVKENTPPVELENHMVLEGEEDE